MQFRLRTLMILLALGPPALAGIVFAWPHSIGLGLALVISLVFAVVWTIGNWCVACCVVKR